MSSFKPIDPKRDEIRRYLERGNVMEPLTKLFIRVIKERPENPMEYIQNNIGIVRHQHDKYERLQKELQNANDEIERLREIISRINPEALEIKVDQVVGDAQEEQNQTADKNDTENEPVESKETPLEINVQDETVQIATDDHLEDAVENSKNADKQTPSVQHSEHSAKNDN